MQENAAIETRVDSLEALLGEFIVHTRVALAKLSREMISFKDEVKTDSKDFKNEMKDFKDEMKDFKDEMKDFKDDTQVFKDEMKDFKDEMKGFKDEMKDFKDEMKDFKDEMKDFKDEMKDFKDEMKDFKDEMKDFKDEMKDFKDEMKDFKDENRQIQKKTNQDWGRLAQKMGTLVEDIIAPAVRPAIRKYFNEDVVYLAVNVKKRIKSLDLKGEFDVVAVGENQVFLIEVKSRPKEQYLDDFLKNAGKFRKLFPEYAAMPLTLIFGSLRFEEDFIPLATCRTVYLMAYREWEYMDILNFDELQTSLSG